MPGQFDGVGGAMRAYVDDHRFALGRVADRSLGDEFALFDGLQQAFAGTAANVDPIDSGGVEAFQQCLEGCGRETLVGVEGRHRGGQNALQIFRLAHFDFPCSHRVSNGTKAMRS